MSGATAEAPRDLPTVVVMGEFSAGKSSLINLLLGEPLMPTQITATQSPAYLLGYGSDPRILAVRRDGGIEEVQTTDPMTLDYRRYEVVRLRRPAPVLKRLMIIDTPGISDPLLPAHALADFADTADMVLWCTLATQAWRESEQSFWREMPSRLKRSSTLVVTKTDLLRAGDLDRLQTRLAAETMGLFKTRVSLSLPRAAAALTGPEEAWTASGGAAILTALGLERADILGPAAGVEQGATGSE